MKTTGIVLVVLGFLDLIFSLYMMNEMPEVPSGGFTTTGILLVLGFFLISRAEKKKKEKEDKEKWINGE